MSFELRQEEQINSEASGDAIDIDDMRALWVAVLQRTLRDATGMVHPYDWRSNRGQGSITVADQADARACLADVDWCEDMCERADVDVSWFRQQITQGGR